MIKPLVSVIMPAYNAALFIKEAVESVLWQDYENLELIIIDDASTDNTVEIIRQFSDPRIVLVEQPENRGIVSSRNKGLALAQGKYVAVLDSDDIALPDRLARQVEFMEANPDHGACGSYYHIVDAYGKRLASVRVPTHPDDAKTFLYFNICFCHSTLIMRTNVARIYTYREGFDILEDYEIAYRISKQWKVANIPHYTTLYRVHGSNTSVLKNEEMHEVRRRMDSIVLNDLDLHYSEKLLTMHSNFLNRNESSFKDPDQLKKLEEWLLYFYSQVRLKPGVNLGMVKRILVVRWAQICYKSGNYKAILMNRLILNFGKAYMKYNMGHLKNLLSGSFEIV